MKTKQTPEVISTRNEVDRLLLLVPNKRYSDCTAAEKKTFDDLSAALQRHRLAVRAARAAA
jgi:hypothetical protein